MVVLLVVLTVLGCIGVDLVLKRREKAAAEARLVREPAALFPSLTAQELPGGLFVHSGHTWAKLDSSRRRAGGAGRVRAGSPRKGRPVRASRGRDGASPGRAGVRRPPVGQADRVRVPRRRRRLRGERTDQRRPGGGAEGALREGVGVHAPAVQPLPGHQEAPDRRGGRGLAGKGGAQLHRVRLPCTGRCPWKWEPPCRTEGSMPRGSWSRWMERSCRSRSGNISADVGYHGRKERWPSTDGTS